jgi:hypothetical protein
VEDAVEGDVEELRLAQSTFVELDAGRQRRGPPAVDLLDQGVDHPDLVTVGEELEAQVMADEAGTSGEEVGGHSRVSSR